MSQEGYCFVTHTPQQAKKWQDICAKDPKRVVRVIRHTLGAPRTREGDDHSDIFPALEAVKRYSRGKVFGGPQDPLWGPLVDSGVADALCDSVETLVTAYTPLPDMPKHLYEKAINDVPAPYQEPLMILCNAATRFTQPPGPHDKIVIAALKSHWSNMMDKVWTEPYNTLRPEGSHIAERMVIGQLVIRTVITDPTVLSIIYLDKTIPVVARHWAHATAEDCVDARVPGGTLHLLFKPLHPAHVKYVEQNPISTLAMLNGILLGVGSSPSSTKAEQVSDLMNVFSKHLDMAMPRDANLELDLLSDLLELDDEDVMYGAIKSENLWRSEVGAMKRCSIQNDPEQKVMGLDAIAKAISMLTLSANIASGKDREQLIRVSLEAGLFDVLDLVVSDLVAMEGRMDICRPLARLFMTIRMLMMSASESTNELIRKQFPRPRILGTLARTDLKYQTYDPENPSVQRSTPVPPPTFVQFSWQMCAALHKYCIEAGRCARRGCEKRGTARCASCKEAVYCGQECQKADWRDHKVLCSVYNLVKKAEGEADKLGEVLEGQERVPF